MRKRGEAAAAAKDESSSRKSRDLIADAEAEIDAIATKAIEDRRKLDADVGPNVVPTLDVGEEVVVSTGSWTIQPERFNSIVIGPFSTTTHVRPGETRLDAGRRAMSDLVALEEEEMRRKLVAWKESSRRLRDREEEG